jgi:hypothetical protein
MATRVHWCAPDEVRLIVNRLCAEGETILGSVTAPDTVGLLLERRPDNHPLEQRLAGREGAYDHRDDAA